MKKLLLLLCILAIVLSSQSFSIAAEPPGKFMDYNLRSIYPGMGDGGTQSMGVTVREFVEIGLHKGSWEKVNDLQWNYRIKTKDDVTKKVTNLVYVFSRHKGDGQLEQFFKNDVILTRIVVNNEDVDNRNIFAIAFKISNKVYPQTRRGKEEIINEKRKQEETIRKKEEERLTLKKNIYDSIPGDYAYENKNVHGLLTVILTQPNSVEVKGLLKKQGNEACVLEGKGILEFNGEKYISVITYNREINVFGQKKMQEQQIRLNIVVNKIDINEGASEDCWNGSFLKDASYVSKVKAYMNEEEANNKQKVMNLQGHYENREGRNYEKKNGEINVKINAPDEIVFSVATTGPRSCRMENKSATLSHSDDFSISEAEFNDGNCRLMFKFRTAKIGSEKREMEIVEIEQRGKCGYCDKGAYIGGRFLKMSNTETEKKDTEVNSLLEKGVNRAGRLFKLNK